VTNQERIDLLFRLSLAPEPDTDHALALLARADEAERSAFLRVADSHHVVLRSVYPLRRAAADAEETSLISWCDRVISDEETRIKNALAGLEQVCDALERSGCAVTVMKSLDHWPDIGNDLDLYTPARRADVVRVMLATYNAKVKGRTWGDRLAHKQSFGVAAIRESVEIHHACLGQTGEHTRMAARFFTRRVPIERGGHRFFVPAPEERIIAGTLQRMYRHFYFRVCDVVNTVQLLENRECDFQQLRKGADVGGVWPGVATFLRVVAEFAARYGRATIELPTDVLESSAFGIDEMFVRGSWIRVPVKHASVLYGREFVSMLANWNLYGAYRLSMLPPLASIARINYKLTGDHTGIW
jgi:Uncharacterised nucleotidyltransferase